MTTRTDDEGRQRAPRKTTERRRRKKRESVTGQRLAATISPADMARFKFRWINDSPTRLFRMTKQDDWEICHQNGGEVKEEADIGSAVSVPVGQNPDGSPMRAYLCRKRADFYQADQEEKMAELDQQLEQMRRGHAPGESQSDYVPHSGISIR